MPGKQMAIDADLSAGPDRREDRRKRRTDLEDESGFFGAMDGASSSFAARHRRPLLIVFINVVGRYDHRHRAAGA